MPTVEATDPPEDANAAVKPDTETSQTTLTGRRKSPNSSSKKAANGVKPGHAAAKAAEKKKPEPTLLHDFLRGRPSASRPTACRPRRKSSGMARAEMKTSAVNKLTPPAKVKNRVLEWQKAARGAGAPEVFDIEEPVLAKQDDTVKTPSRPQSAGPSKKEESPPAAASAEEKSTPVPAASPVTVVKPQATTARKAKKPTLETSMPPTARGAQMKRVVSDTHWMDKAAAAKKETPKAVTRDPIFNLLLNSGAVKKATTTKPSPPKAAELKTTPKKLPKDFTETNWASLPTERKIQDWVQRNAEESAHGEEADPKAVAAFEEAVKEAQKSINSSRSPAKVAVPRAFRVTDVIRKPSPGLRERASREDAEKARPTSGQQKPVLKRERARRVRAARPEEIAAALGLPSPGRKSPKQCRDIDKRYEEKDDRRRLPSHGARRDDRRDRVYEDEDNVSSLTETSVYYNRPYTSKPTTPRAPAESTRDRGSPDYHGNAKHSSSDSRDTPRRQASKPKPRKSRDATTIVTESTLSSLTSDDEGTISDTASVRRDDMKRESKRSLRAGEKPLADIPFGYSAFSVLDLSSNGTPRTRPANPPQRKASIGLPNVLKRAYSEGMKIMQDTIDPPRIVIKNPPNIESWLNGTTDPFLDDPAQQPSGSQTRPKSEDGPKRERSQTYKTLAPRSGNPSRESTPARTYSRPKSSGRDRDSGRDSRDHSRKSSLTETVIPESTVLDRGHESFAGLKRRPARRENSSPFTERNSARDLRTPQPVRDLDSYADNLVRGSGRRSQNQQRSQEHMRVKGMEPLAEASRHNPHLQSPEDAKASIQSLNEKKSGLNKTDQSELTRPTRLRRIPSTGPTIRPSRRHDLFSVPKPEVSPQRSHRQPSRYHSNSVVEGPELKRRLTKHSDLMSMLSLPDTDPKIHRGASIVSARSIRTKRAPPNSRNVSLILSEVRADEIKYFRELRTLVDGVIPVLLSSVLARSSCVAASRSSGSTDFENAATTKSVVEMGEALNLLKDLHSQILLNNSEELITWLLSAHAAYETYLSAWRLGFDDIVVNLAPAAEAHENKNTTAAMPCLAVTKPVQDTETVDVAYLLRRPLERVKYLEKAAKRLDAANPTNSTKQALKTLEGLSAIVRRRRKEEKARKEDIRANKTDVSRVRDLQTLAPAENVHIDKSRQVKAKDYFEFSLDHSNGQRLACEVEIIIRDSRKGPLDGDVLMCEVDDSGSNQWLLFRPIEIRHISAHYGGSKKDLIVTVTGSAQDKKWIETFSLRAETAEIAEDFLDMIGSNPRSPPRDCNGRIFGSSPSHRSDEPSTPITPRSAIMHGTLEEADKDHPIGESALDAENKGKQTPGSVWLNDMGTDHVYYKDSDAARAKTPMTSRTPMSQSSRPPSSGSRPHSKEGETLVRPHTKRRPSSPLKREFNPDRPAQPSAQVSTQYTDSDSNDSYTESELTESDTEVSPEPTLKSAQSSQDSTPSSTPLPEYYCHKFTAHISCWLQDKGQYLDLHRDICSVRVMPGSVKICVMDASHSATYQGDDDKRPLVELELTPLSVLAQRTGLDVEIRTAVLETSQLQASNCIRLRSSDTMSCRALYRRLEQARKDNIVYNTLEQERIISGYGQRQEETIEEFEGRRSWFGRKRSYRASARAPTVESSSSKFSFKNAFTALDRFKMNNRSFDIEKSSMKSGGIFGRNRGSRASIQYAAEDSLSNGFTPPLTAYTPSSVTSGDEESGQFDTTSMRIRLYFLVKATDWYDCGEYIIAITQPPPWMKPKSTLYDGFQRRVTLTEFQEETVADKITKRFSARPQEKVANVAWDEVMGAKCFLRQGKKGILMFTWQALTSKNGVVGQAPDEGGVCGRQQKYMIYSERTAQSRFIYALLGAGGGGLDT